MADKTLEIEFRGKDAFTAEAKKVGASADQLKRKLAEVEAAKTQQGKPKLTLAERIDTGAKSTEEKFGEDRAVGKLLKGGLVGFAGDSLAQATGKAVELQKAFQAGEKDAVGLGVALAESLPIFGGFVTAGQNIREMITGERAEIEQINKAAEQQNKLTEYGIALLERRKVLQKEIASIIETANQKRLLTNTDNDADKSRLQSGFAAQKELDALKQKREGEIAKVKQDRDKQIADLGEKSRKGEIDPDQARSLQGRVKGVADKHIKSINEQFNKADKAQLAAALDERDKLQHDQLEKSREARQKYYDEVRGMEVQQRAAALKALGRDLEAELLLIDENAKNKKEAIAKQLESDLKTTDPMQADMLKVAAQAQQRAVDSGAEQQKQMLMRQQLEDVRTRQLQQQAAAGDRAAELELARLETIKQTRIEYEKLMAVITAQQAVLADPNASQQQKAAAQQAINKAQQGIKNQAKGQQLSIDEQLRKQREALLESQASNGATEGDRQAAKQQLEAQRIRDEMRRRQAELTELLSNPNATADQRKQAQTNFQQWADMQGKAFDNATRGDSPQSKDKFDMGESRTLTGVGAALAEKNAQDWQKKTATATEQGVKLQQELNQQMRDYINWVKSQQGKDTGIKAGAGL